MKRYSRTVALITVLCLLAALCACVQATPPAASTSSLHASGPRSFAAQYIRTDGYHEEAQYPIVTLIRSASELEAYYDEHKELYDLERRDDPAADSTIGFSDACDRYTDSFFKTHCLVLILLEESSGSNRHKITSVHQDEAGKLNVTINTIVPEVGTCDMAQWHILLETTADIENEQAVTLSFQTEAPAASVAAFTDGFASISLPVPDGWKHEITDDGIRLHPADQSQGAMHITYMGGFGVCGTGLQCDTVTLGGYQAEQGTYDNHDVWDYIYIGDTAGDYVIFNEGIGVWWKEYAEQAMEILSGIAVAEGVLHKAEAIRRAEAVCTIDHERIIANFDHKLGIWTIRFYPDAESMSDEQTVTLDAVCGNILEVDGQPTT